MTWLGWDNDAWDVAPLDNIHELPKKPVLQGDHRELIYSRLTTQIRDAVFAYISEHDHNTTPQQLDYHIRVEFIRPLIAEYNREASVVGDDLLPTEAESEIFNRVRGFGPLQQLYDDTSGITEVMCDGPGQPVYYEKDGIFHDTDIILSKEDIYLTIERIQGLGGIPLGYNNPTVEVNLPRARIIAHDQSFVSSGPTICMRMRRANPFTGQDMVGTGVLPQSVLTLLAQALRAGANIIVAGPTGSYKTTMAQSLVDLLPEWHRIVTIEDPIEFSLTRRRLVQMEVRREDGLTPRICLFHALRNNPTNIVLGEVRDASALDLVDLMATGQGGSLCTIHAITPLDAIHRLEGLCMRAADNLRVETVRASILNAVNLVVVLRKKVVWDETGSRQIHRRLTHVTELTGLANDYELTDIVRWENDCLRNTGNGLSSELGNLFSDAGLSQPNIASLLPSAQSAALIDKRDAAHDW